MGNPLFRKTEPDERPVSPMAIHTKEIEEIMAAKDSFVVNRLMQRYRSASDKEAFVAALIGRMMVDSIRAVHVGPVGI